MNKTSFTEEEATQIATAIVELRHKIESIKPNMGMVDLVTAYGSVAPAVALIHFNGSIKKSYRLVNLIARTLSELDEDSLVEIRVGMLAAATEAASKRIWEAIRSTDEVESITTAAIRVNGEIWTLPRPARHHILIRSWSDAHWIHDPTTGDGRGSRLPEYDQGFMTSKGRFVGRDEAESIARAAGQVKGDLIGAKLTSEDLW